MSDKMEELDGQLEAANTEAHMWKSLMEHPAWPHYVAFLEEQRKLRAEVCMATPINSEYTSYAQEMYKGEWNGLGLAITFPQTQYELAEMKRRTLTKEMEIEDAAQKEVRTVVSRVDGDPFGE